MCYSVDVIIKDGDYSCPRCSSSETSQARPGFIAASGILLIGAGAWTLNIPVLGIGFVIAGGIMLFSSPFLKNVHICNVCRKIWKGRPAKKISAEKIIDFMEHSIKYKNSKEGK